jgi:hypothetical protein
MKTSLHLYNTTHMKEDNMCNIIISFNWTGREEKSCVHSNKASGRGGDMITIAAGGGGRGRG